MQVKSIIVSKEAGLFVSKTFSGYCTGERNKAKVRISYSPEGDFENKVTGKIDELRKLVEKSKHRLITPGFQSFYQFLSEIFYRAKLSEQIKFLKEVINQMNK